MFMPWAAAIPAIASFASTMLQQAENDKARDYNTQEAQKARAYNTWLLSNQTQLKANDARSAGLNPAFMNGSILGSNPSVPGSPSSPSTTIPFDSAAILQGMKQQSEIKNIEADTKKKESENERQLIENTYLPQLMQSTIDCNFGDVRLKGSQVNLNDETARATAQKCINLQKEVEAMNKKIELDTASIANLNQDTKIKEIEAFWKSKEFDAIINKMVSETAYNYTQCEDIVKTRAARILGLTASAEKDKSSSDLMSKQGFGIDIENGRLAIQLEMDEKYKEVDKVVDIGGKVLGSVADCLNVFSKFRTHKVSTTSTVNSTTNSTSHSYNQNENFNHTVND